MKFGFAVQLILLSSVATVPAYAQVEPPVEEAEPSGGGAGAVEDPAIDEAFEGEEIVVTGQRPRGSVVGDIEPELTLNPRDIRSYGASNIAELLEQLAPQTQSARGRDGGAPVTLVNGRRISSFAEIRDIPPEAIVRVEILPEEVALKYGYRADQRVVNFVLRERFNAITAELEGGVATAGGRETGEADFNLLRINNNGRTVIDFEYEREGALLESERDIVQADAEDPTDPIFANEGEFRTLLPLQEQFSANGTVSRTLFGDVASSINLRYERGDTQSLQGLAAESTADALRALVRETDSDTGHVGLALNGDLTPWRWSLTANYDRSRTETETDVSGRPNANRAISYSDNGNAEAVFNGSLFDLPAGDISSTIRAGIERRGIRSENRRLDIWESRELSRTRPNIQANVDVPIADKSREVLGFLGDLSLNANAEVEHLSDFGTLTTLGGGFNWEPVSQIRVIASYTDEDGAPSIQQLGDPTLVTPNVRVFDFVRGESVDITRITGGNVDLSSDNRRVFKLGATIEPIKDTDLTLTANYVATRINNPIASFPTATAEIEAAFPDRFVRDLGDCDENGRCRLVSIDSRPVNFERSDRKEFRWGINFSKSIGPEPQPGAFRRGQGGGGAGAGRPGAGQGQQAGGGAPGGGGRAGGPRMGGRGFGGPPGAGRIQFSLYHTWNLENEILIRDGVPVLDLLNGSATGSRGGEPKHEIEFQGGVFKSGLGARVSANWQSSTFVRGGVTDAANESDLSFSDFTTVDLRLFADLGQQESLVRNHPWLRGARISLNIDNVFDSRLQVRDASGAIPIGYQPDELDPLGRAVTLSFRKLFF